MSFSKNRNKFLALLLCLCLVITQLALPAGQTAQAAEDTWSSVGGTTIADNVAGYDLTLHMSNHVPYVGYMDGATGRIYKYNSNGDTTWSQIWQSPETVNGLSFAVDNSTVYAAYITSSSDLVKVYRIEGETVTAMTVTTDTGYYCTPRLYVYDNVLYIAYVKQNWAGNYSLFVEKYNNSTSSWEIIGEPPIITNNTLDLQLSVDSNGPCVAYVRNGYEGFAVQYQYNPSTQASSWVQLGSGSIGQAMNLSLLLNQGDIYLAYGGVNSEKGVVKYNGSGWDNVGGTIATGGVFFPSLAMDNGTLYLAYADYSNSQKVTVKKCNDTSWENVGTPLFSYGDGYFVSLQIDNGVPYVAYRDGRPAEDYGMGMSEPATGLEGKAVLMKLTPGLEGPSNLSAAIDADGQVTLSFTKTDWTDQYLVVRNTDASTTFTPADGTGYTPDPAAVNAVAYSLTDSVSGSAITLIDTGTQKGHKYYYKIYAYTGSGASADYLTGSPLSGTVAVVSGTGTATLDQGSSATAAFPDSGVTISFPEGTKQDSTTLSVTKNTKAPASNFYGSLPGGKTPKTLYYKVDCNYKDDPGTYNITLDFSSIAGTETLANKFMLMKRHDAASPWVNLSDHITNRCTGGVWGVFTLTGLTDFSEFAICEATQTHTVTSADDSDAGTLRSILSDAEDGDVIDFDTEQMGGNKITLASTLDIDKSITINGSDITIDAGKACRVINVRSGCNVNLNNLKIQNGKDTGNSSSAIVGGIYNQGILRLINCVVSGNEATGIYEDTDNNYYGGVGGILQEGTTAQLILLNTTIAGNKGATSTNQEAGGSGGIAGFGKFEIYNSILYGNTGDYEDAYIYGDTSVSQGDANYAYAAACNSLLGRAAFYKYDNSIIYDSESTDINYNKDNLFNAQSGNLYDQNPKFTMEGEDQYIIYGDSPCVDKGDNSYVLTQSDLRGVGFGRTLAKADGASGVTDMGAYEYKYGTDLPYEIPSISSSALKGMVAPVAGVVPITRTSLSLNTGEAGYSITGLEWMNSGGTTAATLSGGKFKAGTVYKAKIELTAASDHRFPSAGLVPTINVGSPVKGTVDGGNLAGNKLTFLVSFTSTEAAQVKEIAVYSQPDKLSYSSGEALDLTGLVATLTYNDDSTENVAAADFANYGITVSPLNQTKLTVAAHNGSKIELTCGSKSAQTSALTVGIGTISAATINGMTAPTAGGSPVTLAALSASAGDNSYTITKITWKNGDSTPATLTAGGKFQAAHSYCAEIELTATSEYKFANGGLTPAINVGTALAGSIAGGSVAGNKLTFTVNFPDTAQKTITGIAVTTQPSKLSYIESSDAVLALDGMIITETYNDATTGTVTFTHGTAPGYETSPANGTLLTRALYNNTRITVTNTESQCMAQTGTLAVNSPTPSATPTPIISTPSAVAPTAAPSSIPTPEVEKIIVNIKEGDSDSTISQITVERSTNDDGSKTDSVTYEEAKALESIKKLKEENKDTARIVIADEKNEISETKVSIPSKSLEILSKDGVNLEIETEAAKVEIAKNVIADISKNSDENLYFNLVPVRSDKQKDELSNRALFQASLINTDTASNISVVGTPVAIETNMTSTEADIVLPLTGIEIPSDLVQREKLLSELGVYIEHSDGTKELIQGELVEYKKGVFGIGFHVNKFSTFTIVRTDAFKQSKADENVPVPVVYKAKITKLSNPAKAVIKGKTVTASVENEKSSLTVKLSVSKGASWKLYRDKACKKLIKGKKLSLKPGVNTAYIKVVSKDGASFKVYSLKITRKEPVYLAHVKLRPISSKAYADKMASLIREADKKAAVSVVKEGKSYLVYADFADMVAAKKACDRLVVKKYIKAYAFYKK